MTETAIRAIFDYRSLPDSMDVLYFLSACELFRRHQGSAGIDFLFLLNPPMVQMHRLRPDVGDRFLTAVDRLYDFAIPSLRHYVHSAGHSIFKSTQDLDFYLSTFSTSKRFPIGYRLDKPTYFHTADALSSLLRSLHGKLPTGLTTLLRAGEAAKSNANSWLSEAGRSGKLLTISLDDDRDTRSPSREDWIEVAKRAKAKGWTVALVPSTEDALTLDLSAFEAPLNWYVAGGVDLALRMALFELSDLVIGPAVLENRVAMMQDNVRCALFLEDSDPYLSDPALKTAFSDEEHRLLPRPQSRESLLEAVEKLLS